MYQKRLPDLLRPSHYAIYLHPSLHEEGFAGEVHINGKLLEASPTIILHGVDLTIHAAHLTIAGQHHPLTWRLEPEHELIHLTGEMIFPPGPVVLHLAYQGRLGQALHGLYRAQDGEDVTLVTQCEATSARAIFPCLDEPHFKAALQWNITAADDLDIITNGKAVRFRHVLATQEQQVVFAPTQPISTYLAALTLGTLACGSSTKIGPTTSRIWASKGKEGPSEFAQAVTRFALPYYENYFDVPYPFGKLDQVAVPGFDAGAMENAGAIFYRQQALLLEPKTASLRARRRVAEIIAHEIAHQWFGNYVTMAWWDDLWLNEAFATWISCKAVNVWQPSYRIWAMQAEAKEEALQMDSLPSTHPIYTEVHHPHQISELFDAITYEKGCTVLRMVESYMGEQAFRAGLRTYMKHFAWGNATAQDLWEQLAKQTNLPVATMMQQWVHQPGFPLLKVRWSTTAQGEGQLHIEQQPFKLSEDHDHPAQGCTWTIPMQWQIWTPSGSQTFSYVLQEQQAIVPLPTKGPIGFAWPNQNGVGFFRTAIEPAMLHQFTPNICRQLSADSRINIIHDHWAMVQAHQLTSVQFGQFLQAFQGETDALVLQTLGRKLRALAHMDVEIEKDPHFAAWIRQLLAISWEKLGEYESIEHLQEDKAEAAATLFMLLGELGQEPALEKLADKWVRQEQQDPTTFEPNLASAAIGLQAHRGDLRRFHAFLRIYQQRQRSKTTPELQQRYLQALLAFEDGDSNQHVLGLLEPKGLPQEHWRTVLCSLLARHSSQHLAWAYLTEHYPRLSQTLGDFGLSRVIECTGYLPATKEPILRRFFKQQQRVPQRALAKALELMAIREKLRQRESQRFRAYLQETIEGVQLPPPAIVLH